MTEFKPGDRVAAFHEMTTPGGSYAEYALSWEHTTFHIPKKTSFEEAATLPLAIMTAALGMYLRLGLPEPWRPATEPTPLVVYGGASAVGAYAIKFAQRSNIHPIIAVAGRGQEFVETLIDRSKGDTIVDYRRGDEEVVNGIRSALKGQKLWYTFDAVSEHNSYINASRVLEQNGSKVTLVLPARNTEQLPKGVEIKQTMVGSVHNDDKDFGFVFFRYVARGLQEGWLKGHPHEVVPGGLGGVQKALEALKDGKASAVKYVFKVEETEGAGKSN